MAERKTDTKKDEPEVTAEANEAERIDPDPKPAGFQDEKGGTPIYRRVHAARRKG